MIDTSSAIKPSLILLMFCVLFIASPAKSASNDPALNVEGTEHLPPEERVKKACGTREHKLCEKLKNDPEYRDRWLSVMDKLNSLERKSKRAIEATNKHINTLEERRKSIIERAYKLKDGSPVFPDANGNFHNENGAIVTDEYIYTPDRKKKFSRLRYKQVFLSRKNKK